MRWERKGLIYSPPFDGSWKDNSALQPTALVMSDRIRLFLGFRAADGVSRIGFVDVEIDDPSNIIEVSESPVLDVGQNGTVDDNGVVPTAIIEHDDKLMLFYAGYQLPAKVRFVAFGGLAISENNGESFERYSKVPVFDRTDDGTLFRVPHSVMLDEGRFKFWYGGGTEYTSGASKTLPVYNIWYLESDSLNSVPRNGSEVLRIKDNEHRVGRPCVIKEGKIFRMFYGFGSDEKPYQLGYAESKDGKEWSRKDASLALPLSDEGWDSEMMAYPCVVRTETKTYLFYNGNQYGRYGFGYAELLEA